ncbi:MAG: hypothetical protein H0V69_00555 [Acidimicrobiia bacterium]|nr:hypothetical protein [Acidimicrobiia bacterium]
MRNTDLRVRIPAGKFAEQLLRHDLPGLSDEQRRQTLAFMESRLRVLPSPMTVGVGAVAGVVGALCAVIGHRRVVGVLARRALPVVRDYVRLLRSLSFAYVWETWPGTAPDGSPLVCSRDRRSLIGESG